MKRLVINADDFGFTPDVNAGIVHAHREGVLTSTTLMANGEAFDDAVRCALENPTLDIGCHLVLVQEVSLVSGRPLPRSMRQLLVALSRKQIDPEAELRAQIVKTLAAGLWPTHLDSHKHSHVVPAVFRTVVRLAHEFKIPWVRVPADFMLPFSLIPLSAAGRYYRHLARGCDVHMTDHFAGFRLTGSLTEDTLASALRSLPDGSTEFMCHPGFVGPELMSAATRLKQSRLHELEALLSVRVRAVIEAEAIELTTFAELLNTKA